MIGKFYNLDVSVPVKLMLYQFKRLLPEPRNEACCGLKVERCRFRLIKLRQSWSEHYIKQKKWVYYAAVKIIVC